MIGVILLIPYLDEYRYVTVELFGTQVLLGTGHVTTMCYDETNIWSVMDNLIFEDFTLYVLLILRGINRLDQLVIHLKSIRKVHKVQCNKIKNILSSQVDQ